SGRSCEPPNVPSPVEVPSAARNRRWPERNKEKGGDAFRRRRPLTWNPRKRLAEVVRNVAEGRVQLVADALHGSNRSNSDQGRDQAVLDRSRTLRIFDQLQKLAHGLAPWFRGNEAPCHAGSA